jgi:hypothetical protein
VPLGVFGLDLDDLVVDDLGLADLVEVLDVVDEAALVVEVVERLLLDGRPSSPSTTYAEDGRRSLSVMRSPLLRNAVCWKRVRRVS